MIENPVERVRLAAPPSCNGGKFETFSSHVSAKAGEKRHDSSGLDHAASQRIGDFHVACDNRIDETRHTQKRVAAQLERITEAVVYPAQNHVDPLQSIYGLQKDAGGTHGR